MTLKHRPTEIKAVIKLLDQEHESVETLAVELLDLLMEIKWNRAPWIAIQRHTGPHFTAWGPYPTRRQAELDVGRRIIGRGCRTTSCGLPPFCEVCTQVREYAYFCQVYDKDVTEGYDEEVGAA